MTETKYDFDNVGMTAEQKHHMIETLKDSYYYFFDYHESAGQKLDHAVRGCREFSQDAVKQGKRERWAFWVNFVGLLCQLSLIYVKLLQTPATETIGIGDIWVPLLLIGFNGFIMGVAMAPAKEAQMLYVVWDLQQAAAFGYDAHCKLKDRWISTCEEKENLRVRLTVAREQIDRGLAELAKVSSKLKRQKADWDGEPKRLIKRVSDDT